MCRLPDGVINSEVNGMRGRIEEYFDQSLKYACESWHNHIDTNTTCTPGVASALHHFLESKFLFWLEVLSILGTLRNAVDALKVTAEWLKVC